MDVEHAHMWLVPSNRLGFPGLLVDLDRPVETGRIRERGGRREHHQGETRDDRDECVGPAHTCLLAVLFCCPSRGCCAMEAGPAPSHPMHATRKKRGSFSRVTP